MGSNSSKMKSNSNISNSEKQSLNSAITGLEKFDYTSNNSHETITRVWIAKKAINLSDSHVLGGLGLYEISEYNPSENVKGILKEKEISIPKIERLKSNLFNINNGINIYPKHWAIILELSNETFVNIQFGRTGFSLKEFDGNKRCENAYLAISEIWGKSIALYHFAIWGKQIIVIEIY